jgi:hypothetical protein
VAPLVLAPQRVGVPRAPYLTVDEYLAVPTGVDTENLLEGREEAAQRDALALAIEDGSSAMDNHVHYVLAATVDTENGRYRVNRECKVRVVCRAKPILEVRSFSFGPTPSTMTAITADAAVDAWIDDTIIEMPVYGPSGVALPRLSPTWGIGDKVYCAWTYVNGWPNTLLAAPAAAADTSVVVTDPTGISGGTQLTAYDVGAKERVTVDPSYVPGSSTVPLLAGTSLAFPHKTGVSLSALPAAVKRAAVFATTAMLKGAPGSSAIVAASVEGEPHTTGSDTDGYVEDIARMEHLLSPFALPFYG